MIVMTRDTRNLGIAIVDPIADKFYNWTTGGFEQPFNVTNHIKQLTPMEASPSIFSPIQAADIGNVLISYTNVGVVFLVLDSTTNLPTTPAVDVWIAPAPVPNPVLGGFLLVK